MSLKINDGGREGKEEEGKKTNKTFHQIVRNHFVILPCWTDVNSVMYSAV